MSLEYRRNEFYDRRRYFRSLESYDRDRSGTLSHAELIDLTDKSFARLLELAHGEDPDGNNLPSFFASTPVRRLTGIIEGVFEGQFTFPRGVWDDLTWRHLSKVACVIDKFVNDRPDSADQLIKNLDYQLWVSLMAMLEPTHPEYVRSRTELPYSGALLVIDADQDHVIRRDEVQSVSPALVEAIIQNAGKTEGGIAVAFVTGDLSDDQMRILKEELVLCILRSLVPGQTSARLEGSGVRVASLPVVNTASFEKMVLQSEVPVMVQFGAQWCPPCRRSRLLLGDLSSKTLKVFEVDVVLSPELADDYEVGSVPYFICFSGGEAIVRFDGGLPHEDKEAKEMLEGLVEQCR